MKHHFRRATTSLAIGGISLFATCGLLHLAGARINTSKSIPLGLYWVSDGSAKVGSYVWFCPPLVNAIMEGKRRGYLGTGFCPGNHGYMMKRVVAVAGDRVDISDVGVKVNGNVLPLSAPLQADNSGRPLLQHQPSHFLLAETEVLLMSDVSATSFDGRYFGPIDRSRIKTTITPVITW